MLIILLKLLSYLPLSFLYRVSDILAPVAFHFYRRKIVYRNLSLAFPDASKKSKDTIARSFYRNLLDMGFELIKLFRISPQSIKERVTFEENEAIFAIRSSTKPILFYTTHLFNWEWMCAATQLSLFPSYPVYKKLQNSAFDRYVYAIRSRFGAVPLEMKSSLRRALSLDGLAGIGLLADQSPFKKNPGKIWSIFMGEETPFYKGTMVLPYLTQYDCFFAELTRKGRGKYHVIFHKMSSPPYQKGHNTIFSEYIALSERAIQNNPDNWLWTHNRWKFSRKESEELIIFRTEK